MRRMLASLVLLLAAFDASAQLANGTWLKRGAHQGMLMVVDNTGGVLRLTYRLQNPPKDAPPFLMTLESKLDGTDAPVIVNGKPSGETMAITRVDERHTTTVLKMNGAVFGKSESELSADAKVITVHNTITGTAMAGQPGSSVEYWDRQ